jgi:hypothetical protein
MNRTRAAGLLLTLGGVAGYLAGLATPYPGRAFSLTAVIVGVTLASIGDGSGGSRRDDAATDAEPVENAGTTTDSEEVSAS